MEKKDLKETIELINFRAQEVLNGKDYEKAFPAYQEMLKALRDILILSTPSRRQKKIS